MMEPNISEYETPTPASRRVGPVAIGRLIGVGILLIFSVLAVVAVLSGPASSFGGVFINTVDPGSPAEAAGVLAGEVITEINGEKLQSAQSMQELIFDNLGQPMAWTLTRLDSTTPVTKEVTPLASPAVGQRAAGIIMQNLIQTEGRRAQVVNLLPVAYVGIGLLAVTQLFALWRRRTGPTEGRLGTA